MVDSVRASGRPGDADESSAACRGGGVAASALGTTAMALLVIVRRRDADHLSGRSAPAQHVGPSFASIGRASGSQKWGDCGVKRGEHGVSAPPGTPDSLITAYHPLITPDHPS